MVACSPVRRLFHRSSLYRLAVRRISHSFDSQIVKIEDSNVEDIIKPEMNRIMSNTQPEHAPNLRVLLWEIARIQHLKVSRLHDSWIREQVALAILAVIRSFTGWSLCYVSSTAANGLLSGNSRMRFSRSLRAECGAHEIVPELPHRAGKFAALGQHVVERVYECVDLAFSDNERR